MVQAAGTADVRAAVLAARRHGLPFAVQATGHGTHVAHDGALLLRTGAMSSVLVDPDRRVARVGPGARWADVLAAAAPFGLAPLSGSSPDVGVTGYTLGGGLGWLAREHGLAADSVLRAQVVTADGDVVTADADRNPDLFWALRGGGGSFGVVTALEFRLHPVAQVYAGAVTFGRERAAETLAFYRRVDRAGPGRAQHRGAAHPRRRRWWSRPCTPATPTAAGRCSSHCGRSPDRSARTACGSSTTRTRRWAARSPAPSTRSARSTTTSSPRWWPSRTATVEIRHWGGRIARDSGAAAHRDAPLSVILDTVADRAGPRRPWAAPASAAASSTSCHDPSRTRDGVHGGELGRRCAGSRRRTTRTTSSAPAIAVPPAAVAAAA